MDIRPDKSKKIKKKHNSNILTTAAKNSGDDKTDLDGWTHIGYYGFCQIYAKDDKRRIVNPKTGRSTFVYGVTMSNTGRSVINLNWSSISRGKKKDENKSERL